MRELTHAHSVHTTRRGRNLYFLYFFNPSFIHSFNHTFFIIHSSIHSIKH